MISYSIDCFIESTVDWKSGNQREKAFVKVPITKPHTLRGTENVEAISYRLGGMCNLGCEILLGIWEPLKPSATAFAKMCNLRFIEPLGSLKLMDLSNSWYLIRIPDLSSIAPNLEFLYLNGCKSLVEIPSLQNLSNLVELSMRGSKLIQLWNGGDKLLENLKLMDLRCSDDLIRIPNLSSIAPNVEFLYLEECLSLVEIPSLQNLSKLTELYLTGSNKIKDCPEIPCNIRILKLDRTGIEQLPSSIKHLSQLVICPWISVQHSRVFQAALAI
ncbi:hypothetical protein GH714_022134 [Hevea brasiliensis]|uniref:Uncharacterized protein n=1 Tax=Hevea brasiliensis TaxID=3981 RepID=A0A6A6N2X7_HEVBR|nr:hypothetical protein GH714_022134 [Hevea brasiliensis]